ncbi:hypothetical protein AYI68_g7086 [Smittium mucronatum]|uniref:Uncharacterized protein n=1 Tax=Smittium mucronatum TaxID=133383 RepID=A0A1R0GPM1_9FUNG|nr:hypothetical protein AYI68_g7086 [Smittium mucronatum]
MASGTNDPVNFSAKNKNMILIAWGISGVSSKLKVSEIIPSIVSFPTNDVSDVAPDTALSSSGFWTDESQMK